MKILKSLLKMKHMMTNFKKEFWKKKEKQRKTKKNKEKQKKTKKIKKNKEKQRKTKKNKENKEKHEYFISLSLYK